MQDANGVSTQGIGEIIIGKQRNGHIGDAQLAFVSQYARFENLSTYYAPGAEYMAAAESDPYTTAVDQPPATDSPFYAGSRHLSRSPVLIASSTIFAGFFR